MLINCTECGHPVSDRAESCPHCANPLGGTKLIEQSSKGDKAGVLVCLAVVLLGVVLICMGEVAGCAVIPVGMILTLIALTIKWWHHG